MSVSEMESGVGPDGLTLQERRWYRKIETAREMLLKIRSIVANRKGRLDEARDNIPGELLEELKSSEAEMEGYSDDIRDAVAELKHAEILFAQAKKAKKDAVDTVLGIIAEGPSPQQVFSFVDEEGNEREDWRPLPVSELPMPVKYDAMLKEAGIETIGELSVRVNVAGWWRDVAGIGKKAAEVIEEAFSEFWKFHPEYV
jgi:hypothetical protein